MRPLALLALLTLPLGCTGSPDPDGGGSGTGTGTGSGSDEGGGSGGDDTSTDTGGFPQPELVSPAEAPDLDPADGIVEIELTASPMVHEVLDWRTGRTLEVWGFAYNGQVPGPTIVARKGELLRVTLHNELGVPTTIHWHGVSVPWDMDGVTWMQEPIGDGETFTYELPLEDAGTFWYHPHYDTDRQVDLGLYGVLVVEDPEEDGAFDREIVAVLDDWANRDDEEDGEHEEDEEEADEGHDHGAGGDEGLWTVNGLVQPVLPVVGGETLRLRLLDASNTGYLSLDLAGADEVSQPLDVVATDQGRLPGPLQPERLLLSSGDRAEVALLPGEDSLSLRDHPYSHQGGVAYGEIASLIDLEVASPAAAAALPALPWEAAAPSEDPGTTDVRYTFQGDPHSAAWMINGEVYPDVTVQSLALGQDAVIEVRNVSATEHPFHLHGMHFEVLSRDGVAPAQLTVEDTVNLALYETVRLRVLAVNPGDWMAHCHILPHGHGGMMTVLRVE